MIRILIPVLALAVSCGAAELSALPEHLRPDPFGAVVQPDAAAGEPFLHALKLTGSRGGWVSAHIVAKAAGDYSLSVSLDRLKPELYREWFHAVRSAWYPDALVPVSLPYRSRLPEPDNRIPNQTTQAFWLDIWIAPETPPGTYRGEAMLENAGSRASLPVEIEVLRASIPAGDVVSIDHNSYGTSWLSAQYGVSDEAGLIRLIHAYHRIFYEHRGVYHQLGYGHAGKVGPEFAPVLEGSGRKKHVASWDLYDRHYGPLFDGSAFKDTHRGPHPIPYAYLPINPEWPASQLWWGEPGYEAEFVNVVSGMERHFREKGWTHTRLEVFFNHKKRYKGFSWDGDETRFPDDLAYFHEYGRLLHKAVPSSSPVQFVFRADSSWMMERQFRDLAGIVNFWVCGGGEFPWFRDSARMLKQRGDIVWIYGGPPAMNRRASDITLSAVKPWMLGVEGWVHWQTVDPGRDPWFHSDGSALGLVYPGKRFGIDGPIPSVRLKIQRNAVQDLALLDSLKASRSEVARRYNGTTPDDWWTARPAFADKPTYEWTNADYSSVRDHIRPGVWTGVREYAIRLAKEAK